MNNAELVATILKKGGKCLIAGGSVNDLPKEYQTHPQIILWDDNDQNLNNKAVPSNVKIILYNRWISHTNAKRLSNAAAQLKAIKFPMLKTREIKTLLAEFLQADAIDMEDKELESKVEETIAKQDFILADEVEINSNEQQITVEPTMPKKTIAAKGEVQRFLARRLNLNIDYKVKGSIAKEAKRLFALSKEDGVKTTESSLNQAISKFVRNKSSVPVISGNKVVHVNRTEINTGDDFEELDKLLGDAISAMKLIQEHLPKVRKETERLRSMKDKVMKLFAE